MCKYHRKFLCFGKSLIINLVTSLLKFSGKWWCFAMLRKNYSNYINCILRKPICVAHNKNFNFAGNVFEHGTKILLSVYLVVKIQK